MLRIDDILAKGEMIYNPAGIDDILVKNEIYSF